MSLIICPNCGKKVSDKAIKCPKCGCLLNKTTIQNDMERCPKCGTMVEKKAASCPNCGMPLVNNGHPKMHWKEISDDEKDNTTRNRIIGFSALFIIGCILSFFLYSARNKIKPMTYVHGDTTLTNETVTDSKVSVSTIIFDGTSQPPIVGGYINNYKSNAVVQKGIIVGQNERNMDITSTDEFEKISEFRYLMGGDEPLTEKKCYDCTSLNAEQYALQLQHLMGDEDYYIRAFIKTPDYQYFYGSIEKIHTQSFNRYSDQGDKANIFHAFDYTLFDLMTDEIIDPSTDGFYYSTNENPISCNHQDGIGFNTCYKFMTEWNYYLWYCHCSDGTTWKSYDTGVYRPVMTFANNALIINKNEANATDDITIYYSIDCQGNRPETFTDVYEKPLKITKPCTVYCYAKRNDGNISFTNMYKVFNSYFTEKNYR